LEHRQEKKVGLLHNGEFGYKPPLSIHSYRADVSTRWQIVQVYTELTFGSGGVKSLCQHLPTEEVGEGEHSGHARNLKIKTPNPPLKNLVYPLSISTGRQYLCRPKRRL
jgi:hypothetical protein